MLIYLDLFIKYKKIVLIICLYFEKLYFTDSLDTISKLQPVLANFGLLYTTVFVSIQALLKTYEMFYIYYYEEVYLLLIMKGVGKRRLNYCMYFNIN